jgi:hypothetical protein
VDQPSAATPPDPAAKASAQDHPPSNAQAPTAPTPGELRSVGFAERGRVRRRARFLRKARELAYRDLGGLVFNLHRFGQRNDALVLGKLDTLSRVDAELRTLESALSERQPVTVLREAGITACPRCAAIHSGEDRFCPNCGLPGSRHVDLPIAGQQAAPAAAHSPAGAPSPEDIPSPIVAPSPVVTPAPTADQAAPPDEGEQPSEEPTKIVRPSARASTRPPAGPPSVEE